ncbi:UNVERIFIED_CONTAM: hypothetical protein Sradi_4356400 [Sesamum radiatum]|uniref:Retrotransposon Copia-like N-terminal domain-containing protein n=1 Tax=Sesamum radiatum TaxID=300843 RepID=A0AAW2NRW0_SESRA
MAEAAGSSRRPSPIMFETGDGGRQSVPEILQLHGSDHPGMILVSTLLTKTNYLTWSYAVKRALRAKMKLGFIDGTSMKPCVTDPFFEQWIRVDSMVTTWILNCISKEIVSSFMYAKSARTLWLDLEERYGECNGPLLYQLLREIASSTQGNKSVVDYFSRLRMIWDELDVLMPTPQCTCGCTCGASKTAADQAVFIRLIQFLMGLSETFDHMRDQLLVMDPIPTVNKAYSMILRVEKQREVNMEGMDNVDNAVMQVRTGNKKEFVPRQGQQRTYADKRGLHCSNCDRPGHARDTCFKIHGTPDWYKDLIEKRKKEGGNARGYNVRTEEYHCQQHKTDNKEVFMQQLIRLMKGEENQTQMQEDPLQANFAQLDNFAGKSCAFTDLYDNLSNSWIVDTGATNHMCANKHILHSILPSSQPTLVYLPDGTTQSVTHKGSVSLHPDLTLIDVLHVPQFQYNLLSVSKLCLHSSIEVKFYSSHCLLQDLETKRIIAIGKLHKNLYMLNKSSFSPLTIASLNSVQHTSCSGSESCNIVLWHRRLGHPSLTVLKHVPVVNSTETMNTCMVCPR